MGGDFCIGLSPQIFASGSCTVQKPYSLCHGFDVQCEGLATAASRGVLIAQTVEA
jgi:hypothetical protein